jgi:hypothetical protein
VISLAQTSELWQQEAIKQEKHRDGSDSDKGLRANPGFPVQFGGIDVLHTAFLNESRTRGRWSEQRTGNPGIDMPLLK